MRSNVLGLLIIALVATGNATADETYLDTNWDDGDPQGFTTTNLWTLGTAGNVPPPAASGNYWYGASTGGPPGSAPPDDFLTSPIYTMGVFQLELTLEFTQRYWMSPFDDGGVIEVSVNQGAFTYIPSPDVPDYDATISSSSSSLFNVLAYNGTSAGFFDPAFRTPATIVTLDNFVSPGDDFQIRFRQADNAGGVQDGWYIDQMRIFTNSAIPEPSAIAILALSALGLIFVRRRN